MPCTPSISISECNALIRRAKILKELILRIARIKGWSEGWVVLLDIPQLTGGLVGVFKTLLSSDTVPLTRWRLHVERTTKVYPRSAI
jgi:hypothetical protein